MRATLRITWLLLSLSFLFYSVCLGEDGAPVTIGTPDPAAGATPATTVAATTARVEVSTANKPQNDGTSKAPTEVPTTTGVKEKNDPTQKPTTVVVTTLAAIVTTPVAKTDSTQPQATTVTNNTPAKPNTPGNPPPANGVTTPIVPTNVPPKTVNPATESNHGSGVTTRATTVQITTVSIPTKVSEAPGSLPGTSVTVESSKNTVVPTDATTVKQVSKPHISITSTMSQGDSTGVTTKESKKNQELTSLKPTQLPGSIETTSIPSSQSQTRASTVGTVGSRDATTPLQTTTAATTTNPTSTTPPQPKKFVYSLLSEQETKEEKDLAKVCKLLMANWQNGTCTLTYRHDNGKKIFDSVEINGKVPTSVAAQYYEEITKEPTDNKTLIAILASCGALLIMIVILAVCASHHRKPYNENQQHLTEELHTVENGYHDNPTLEVMEVQPEMQEKKVALNGEFNDSWIVPIDNLLKEDIPDEEDTHL
ncbi:podocalyxin isoform X2 [Amphiprion ocellaris]|uniref:podocalyxin isoform X2 n=1 Tax=Amphiprion ocellaris TaxID=80972 RepID=UPI00164986A8|nr:podocalyxin isoform X2 [Amphiprion ocellaris]